MIKTGIGQDSHRFLPEDATKPCVVAGCLFESVPGLKANSDGDVVYHAICNAISSVTGELVLGGIADTLFYKHGITDSSVYLEEARKLLEQGKQKVEHVAITIEGSRPHFREKLLEMRANIAKILRIEVSQVGITATSGEGLTDFGCGDGLQCIVILTTST